MDKCLDGCCYLGILLSSITFITGRSNSCLFFILWSLYLSIVNAGGHWYNTGWDNQILETGFLAIWIVPLSSFSKFLKDHQPPWISIILFKWLVIRTTLGPGLGRIKSDDLCWRNLSCKNNLIIKLQYIRTFSISNYFQGTEWFYETQPVPNVISYFAHQVVWEK